MSDDASCTAQQAPQTGPALVEVADLPSPQQEAKAFWRMRYRILRAKARYAITHARFRLLLLVVLSAILWSGVFWLAAAGFEFLHAGFLNPQACAEVVRRFMAFFCAVTFAMLLISSGVILYCSLFRSPETAFLLSSPVRTQRVFLHKFQEAVVLSSWGFLLLGSPVLLAYGVVSHAPWYYFAVLPALMVAFVHVPSAIGAIVCLKTVHWLPGRLRSAIGPVAVLAAVAVTWGIWNLVTGPEGNMLTPKWFHEITQRLSFSEGRLMPSWWLSTGLMEAAADRWDESLMFLILMVANALFCRQLAIWTAGHAYRPAYHALQGRRRARRRSGTAWMDRAMLAVTLILPRQIRLLLVKDWRLFRRDPIQWSQFLIFFALLALYFYNLRRVTPPNLRHIGWINLISFLNISVVGLLLSTFTTRFIFPMISLERHHFWVLGLLPVRRGTILWAKFFFAIGSSIVPCSILVLLSDVMLRVPMVIVVGHQLTCVTLCVGLSGIAVGLGARLPSLNEMSPPRIAAGFGGTLALVVSTLYIIAIVLLTALPSHFYLVAQYDSTVQYLAGQVGERAEVDRLLRYWLAAGTVASVLVGILATVFPLRAGFRAFEKLEC